MFIRKMLPVLFVTLLVVLCATSGWAVVTQVVFSGSLYNTTQSSALLCAEVLPSTVGAPVTFTATAVYGSKYTAGPVFTTASVDPETGTVKTQACARKSLPIGVYSVKAVSGAVTSAPVAVTVWSPFLPNNGGFFSGTLAGSGPPVATFGGIQPVALPSQSNFQTLYIDPVFPITVTIKSFRHFGVPLPGMKEYLGDCQYQMGASPLKYGKYDFIVQFTGTHVTGFGILVYDLANRIVYSTAGVQAVQGGNP